jgi:hypothetical protein
MRYNITYIFFFYKNGAFHWVGALSDCLFRLRVGLNLTMNHILLKDHRVSFPPNNT